MGSRFERSKMADENTDPKKGQSESEPSDTKGGKSEVNSGEAHSNLPDHLKGKSAEDIYKMYSEAEKKMGEMSAEVKQSRDTVSRYQPIIDLIWEDESLFSSVEQKLQGKSAPKKEEDKPKSDSETRTATEGLIISRFEDRFGINNLPEDQRKDLKAKIGQEIITMTGQRISDIPLARLETVLEGAFVLANKEKLKEAGKLEGLTEATANNSAVIGAIPHSGSAKSEEITLSAKEKDVARKLGLTQEKFLEGKKKVAEYR